MPFVVGFCKSPPPVFETDCCTSFIRPPALRSPILSREEEVISDIADTFFCGARSYATTSKSAQSGKYEGRRDPKEESGIILFFP